MKKILTLLLITTAILVACDDDYYDREIIKNTFTGLIEVTSVGLDPAGDFIGLRDSGEFSFAWHNPQNIASVDFDVTTIPNSSVQLIVKDNKGKTIFDKQIPFLLEDSFSGLTQTGESGTWIVTLIFTNLTGEGSYSLHPGA